MVLLSGYSADPKTFNIDINQLKKKITKKTKAILIVHIYGLPVDIDEILKITKKKKNLHYRRCSRTTGPDL